MLGAGGQEGFAAALQVSLPSLRFLWFELSRLSNVTEWLGALTKFRRLWKGTGLCPWEAHGLCRPGKLGWLSTAT